MKSLLIYFTGTYNTRYLTKLLNSELIKRGHQTEIIEVTKDTPIVRLDEYDNIFISYPIYGFNIPHFFKEYLMKIKYLKNKNYIIYKNSGETFRMNDVSSRKIIRRIKRVKAYYSEYHFVYPYNIHFRFPDEFIYLSMKENDKLMDIMLYNLDNKIIHKPKESNNIIYKLAAFFVGIQSIGGDINSFLYKVDMNKCSRCMKCINNCDMNNIYYKDDKIKFHHKCNMCMRCSFFCPKDAFKIGFLEGWKVNGSYNLDKIRNMKEYENSDFLNSNKEKFYSCFKNSFKEIDDDYEKIHRT